MRIKAIPRRVLCLHKGWVCDTLQYLTTAAARKEKTVTLFEEAFTRYIDVPYACAVSSGRSALDLILENLEIGEGDEVILPAYTDESVPQVLQKRHITPVFVDIRKDDHTIDTKIIKQKITSQTKAIIATHLFGQLCNMRDIQNIATQHSLKVIEDCAHAVGTKNIGENSDAAFFSFADSKPLTTFAGGMVTTHSKKWAMAFKKQVEKLPGPPNKHILQRFILPALAQHLMVSRLFFSISTYPFFLLLGMCNKDITFIYRNTFKKITTSVPTFRLSPYQAWIGIHALLSFDQQNKTRKKNAFALFQALSHEARKRCKVMHPETNAYFFILVTEKRKKLVRYLLRKGIDTGEKIMRNCPKLLGETTCYPVTEKIYKDSIQIPIHHKVEQQDIEYIAKAINHFFEKKQK